MAEKSDDTPVLHSPEEIRGFIERNFSGVSKTDSMSIGLVGGHYRVGIIDRYKVLHTLKIEPKWIDDEKEKMASLKIDAGKAAQRMTAQPKGDQPTRKQKPRH